MTAAQPRRRLSADERREQLMDATVRVVARAGYTAASTAEIAQGAGVAKGLVWHYFEDREALMESTALRALERVRARVGEELDHTAPVETLVRQAMQGAVALLHSHPDELAALREIVLHLRRTDGSRRFGLDDYEETFRGQEALFRRAQERGEVAPDLDLRVVAVSYQGVVDGMLGYLAEHPELDAAQFAADAARTFVGGLNHHAG